MGQGNTAALGIDGSAEPAPIAARVQLDAEASAFVRVLMRERGVITPSVVLDDVVRAGLEALGL